MAATPIAFLFCFIALVSLQHATAATVHVVGDTTGWTVPSAPALYSDWAAKNKFAVGDSLKFNFATFSHDVQKVTKESFESCSTDDAIGNALTTGPAIVKLDTAGEHYFICTVGKHCLGGQKLAVTVSATPGGALPPSSNTSQPPEKTPPSATTPATSPSQSPPNGGGSAAAPAPSSSTAVMATLYVTLSAIVMSLLF